MRRLRRTLTYLLTYSVHRTKRIFKVFDQNDVTVDHADGIRSAGKAKQEGQHPLTGQRAANFRLPFL